MRAFILYFAILLWSAGCSKPTEKPPVSVAAFCVEPYTVPAKFQFVGVAKSSHPVEIRARVEGYLIAIDYLEGSMVDKDKLLFELDHRPFIASVDSAKGALAREEAILWRAKENLKRIEPLYKENAASERDLDNAIAQVLAAEAAVIIAKANLFQAELNLSYSYITSPIRGLTQRALFREGSLITPNVNGLLTEVSVIDPIWVYFSVSDNELLAAKSQGATESLILPKEENYTVTLEMADGSLYPHQGKVNFLSPTLDPKTGTMTVRAEFPNPKSEILPGQFVRAYVSGALRPNALLVPQESVFQGNNGKHVWVIGADQTVSLRSVETGSWYQNYWVIQKGLRPGEHVVASGTNKVQNGAQVNVTATSTFKAEVE